MEETLGKRIVAARKRLGMTQDALAERLGVTAQAVSKWENDQSCPDITMLPKLAEIFGTSVDALLGCEPHRTVREGTVVTSDDGAEDDTRESNGFHIQNGKWELRYDAGKRTTLGIALWILLVGSMLLLSNLRDWETNFWQILWPSGLMMFGLFGLYPKFSFFRLGCALFGGYFFVSNLGIARLSVGKEYLLPIFLLLFGLSLLADGIRRPWHNHFSVYRDGKKITGNHGRFQSAFETGDDSFECSTSFGEDFRFISLPRLSRGEAEVSFGELTVDLSGCDSVTSNCCIDAECAFGQMTILVPATFRVELSENSAFGSVSLQGHPAETVQGTICINASASFGEIRVQYT